MVGLAEVLQHIPFAVTATPPSSVTFPPLVAEAEVILEAAVVVIVGINVVGAAVNDRLSMYQ